MKAIRVQYLPATNTLPARYKATAEGVKPLVVSVARANSLPALAVGELCHRQGWSGTLVSGGLPDGSEVFCRVDQPTITVQS